MSDQYYQSYDAAGNKYGELKPPPSIPNTPAKCPTCGQPFQNEVAYNTHYLAEHAVIPAMVTEMVTGPCINPEHDMFQYCPDPENCAGWRGQVADTTEVSLCQGCYCATKTVDGKCGKCGAPKPDATYAEQLAHGENGSSKPDTTEPSKGILQLPEDEQVKLFTEAASKSAEMQRKVMEAPTPPLAAPDALEHRHGDNCELVMAIRNTNIANGVTMLDAYVARLTQEARTDELERLKVASSGADWLTGECDVYVHEYITHKLNVKNGQTP